MGDSEALQQALAAGELAKVAAEATIDLRELLSQLFATQAATGAVLRALMLSHPDPAAMEAQLDVQRQMWSAPFRGDPKALARYAQALQLLLDPTG